MENLVSTFNKLHAKSSGYGGTGRPGAGETAETPTELLEAVDRMGLLASGDKPRMTALAGGVSSDIWRLDLARGTVCVKRALPKLRVSADWQAPVERSDYEREWLKFARSVVGESVPKILGSLPGMFVMEYLDPAQYPVWKSQLRDGMISPSTAAEVGRVIGKIHAATANNPAFAQRFASDRIFHSIRLEPYLIATAQAQPDVAPQLMQLAEITAKTRLALVHGDVSPKNILVGSRGPVLLDAECAWYGDPAFDVAFCLNHLLLKCIWRPQWRDAYLQCFDAFLATYKQRVIWERPEEIDQRAARLLPGLMLARVHGKSPVEYIRNPVDAEKVCAVARKLLLEPVARLAAVRETWRMALLQ